MYRRELQFVVPLLLLFLAAPAWTQSTHYSVPAASVEDAFSAYHEALSGAADGLLAATAQLAPEPASLRSAVTTRQPEDGALRQFARQYWDGQERNASRAVARVAQLRPVLEPILHQEGVPADVVALVLVESGGHTAALSPKGALGLWQLMPETARRYGLSVNPGLDERVDLVKSTRAAARYLRDLYATFGDWNLTFAAYNAGGQAVQRAIALSGARDFASLSRTRRLALETRNYVPAVLSAIDLLGGSRSLEAATRMTSFRRSGTSRVLYARTEADD
jgi:membrane-bound lytic murein transglycosylase D